MGDSATNRLSFRGLPAGMALYADQVTDLRWTWSHAGDALWKRIDPETWELTENPFTLLQNLTEDRIEALLNDEHFMEQVRRLEATRQKYNQRPGWYGETHTDSELKGVAYFSMEFGLGQALPLYAGGLGVLAGDHLKAASDLGVPMIAIGLLYQEGYFRQVLNGQGWQQEVYTYNDSTSLPIRPVRAPSGAWLHVSAELPGRTVRFRVWFAQVGRITLYLLDSNDPLNTPRDRGITSKLYGGGQELRLVQEIALGICGWRLIEALDLKVDVCHLNEGHAAFAALERARQFMEKHELNFWEALWATRVGNVFTTHTPVAAGFDTFAPALLEKYGQVFADRVGLDLQELGALGRKNPADSNEPFNMAYLAARTCGTINGVSRLHGEVSRYIFKDLYPRWPVCQVPVTHVTNGVHVPSWDSPWADEIWTKACGKDRWLGTLEAMASAIQDLSDEQLWSFRAGERADLVRTVRRRLARQLGQRGESPEAIVRAGDVLDPNILTLGFARRFTEYKRPNLLVQDPARLIRLLTNPERRVQIVIAGKAHPQDVTGKRFVQQWAQFVQRPEVRAHAVFVEDYDIALAQELVQGVDVWINTPRRPWEASGTSGMKVLVNGGLNLSELDGWWAEAYSEDVGWALGDGKEHPEPGWDGIEAEQLYRLLEEHVVPEFYDRDSAGIPRAWVKRIRTSMARLAPQFSTNRMVREYVEKLYMPATKAFHERAKDDGRLARELYAWDRLIQHHWGEVHLTNLKLHQETKGFSVEIHVYLGEVSADLVQVQLYADPIDDGQAQCVVMERGAHIPGAVNGFLYHASVTSPRSGSDFTPRVVPFHPHARLPVEGIHILWWSGVS